MGAPRTSRSRRFALALAAFGAIGAALTGLVVVGRDASLDRTWDEDVRVLSGVEGLPDGAIRLMSVRDWRYTRDSVVSKAYFAERYDPSDITDLWLYEQELGFGGRIAHTFLVFEFPESYGASRWLGLSVETRREVGESYSLVGGMLRAFEVTHIWATEEDLVTRRVEFLDYPLTRYRVSVPTEYLARIFQQFARETASLATVPRWYNTLTTNCTSSLVSYVNEVKEDAIPWNYSLVLTGRADAYLTELGYLDAGSAERITRERLEQGPLR
ncbi:MAG: DUF4105 domain-containing protein [Longimicrobiales bacterium]